jgi:hypothetical protein
MVGVELTLLLKKSIKAGQGTCQELGRLLLCNIFGVFAGKTFD